MEHVDVQDARSNPGMASKTELVGNICIDHAIMSTRDPSCIRDLHVTEVVAHIIHQCEFRPTCHHFESCSWPGDGCRRPNKYNMLLSPATRCSSLGLRPVNALRDK